MSINNKGDKIPHCILAASGFRMAAAEIPRDDERVIVRDRSISVSRIRLCHPRRLAGTSSRSEQSIFIINNSPFTPHVSP